MEVSPWESTKNFSKIFNLWDHHFHHICCVAGRSLDHYSFTPCALQLRRNWQWQILDLTDPHFSNHMQ